MNNDNVVHTIKEDSPLSSSSSNSSIRNRSSKRSKHCRSSSESEVEGKRQKKVNF